MTKKKDRILLYYSLITLSITFLITLVTGFYTGQQTKDHLVDTHLAFYPDLILHMTEDAPQIIDFFHGGAVTQLPDKIQNHIDMLLLNDSIISIKIWNRENTILWSNDPELSEMQFPKSGPFDTVLDGEIHYEFTEMMLKIYLPVMHDDEIIGALEIHESNQKLNDKIREVLIINRLIMVMAGLLLYILLFFIFAKAYRKQKDIAEQIEKTENVTIHALAYQAGLRDEETGQHLKRTAEYVRIIAEELAQKKKHKTYLNPGYISDLSKSAPLHDIGKVGIEDRILKKPGKLTDHEYERIKEHCELGARMLEEALAEITFRSFLDIAIQLVRYHHERWDGKGYPYGLTGERIPLSARIMAISDVYDALRSKRYYKEAFSHEKSMEIIVSEKGRQFDPEVVEAFLKTNKKFLEISELLAD